MLTENDAYILLWLKFSIPILARYADSKIIVIGTSADTELGDKLAAVDPQRIHNLAGTTSIAQSAALLQRCALLVGNDGGSIDLGGAIGCKVVSIARRIEFPDSNKPSGYALHSTIRNILWLCRKARRFLINIEWPVESCAYPEQALAQ